MSQSLASLPDGVVREIFRGVTEEETAWIDEYVGRRVDDVMTMSGSIPVSDSDSSLGRGLNKGLPPLAEAEEFHSTMGSVAYNATAYVGLSSLSDEAKNDRQFYGEDALAEELTKARRDSNTALDLYLSDILTSTSFNVEYDVTSAGSGAWDDGGLASDPITDIRSARDSSAPGSDTIIVGRLARNALQVHPDVIAQFSNIAAGTIGDEALLNWLKVTFGFENALVFDKKYNSANSGQSTSISYIFDTGIWIGTWNDVVLVHPDMDNQDNVSVERMQTKRGDRTQVERYDDIIRPTQEKGCTLTNAVS
jgi:hypothetical protein